MSETPATPDRSYPAPAPGSATAPPASPSPAAHTPRASASSPRRVGVGVLAACVLAAGLVGGGAGAVMGIATTQGASSTESAQGSGDQAPSGTAADTGAEQDAASGERNGSAATGSDRPSGTSRVAAAAEVASPSVVTLSVRQGSAAGSGSGAILDTDGHILTNTHVVTLGGQAADPTIHVQTSDGKVYTGTIVGTDPLSDLAVIKIDAQGLTPITLGSSGEIAVGDEVVAIGAPLGLSGTVTDGIVSTLDRTIAVQSAEVPEDGAGAPGSSPFQFPGQGPAQSGAGSVFLNVIQTDAAINPGNSGGALVDTQGRLLGINVAIASAGGGASGEAGNIGVGFAIPVDYARRVAEDLIAEGSAQHGLLGVQVTAEPAVPENTTPETSDDAAAPVTGETLPGGTPGSFSAGARIVEVVENSPAADAGLQADDVITAVDGRRVSDSQSLTALVREYRPEAEATVRYLRDGQEQETQVRFAAGD
ncbi:MAG: trypsin-like peptidase domain-containing protein [Micrococcus sp.]|nr:trypsin-like peptidase domain-containing protein [Micrococcus sp.]